MPEQVTFEPSVRGGRVRGTLSLPDEMSEAVPAVLVCEGVEGESAPMDDLWEGMRDSLAQRDVAVARFLPRCSELIHEDFHAYSAEDHLEDLTAALKWLADHHAVADTQIGLIGYGIGGATAACLAKQSKRIVRLCLLNAAVTRNGHASRSSANEIAQQLTAQPNGADTVPGIAEYDPPRAYLETLNELGTLQHLSRYEHPVLLLHGAADRIVKPENLFVWSDAAESGSVVCEPCLIARADHCFDDPHLRTACIDRIERFFVHLHPAGRSRKRR